MIRKVKLKSTRKNKVQSIDIPNLKEFTISEGFGRVESKSISSIRFVLN